MIDARDVLRRAVLTADEVLDRIERLAALNARGDDVLVRPSTGFASGLVVIDDLTAAGLRRLGEDGHAPVIVTRTPDGHYQAWIRLAAGAIEPRVAVEAARLLQGHYALSDELAHLGPLAGFIDHTGARLERGERRGEAPSHGVSNSIPPTTIEAIGDEVGRVTAAAERTVVEARERVAAQGLISHGEEATWGAWLIDAFAEELQRDDPIILPEPHYRRRRRIERDERGDRDGR